MKKITFILTALLILLPACASMKIEKDKISSVRRVAIIGFDVQQQRPVEFTDLVKIATHQDTTSKAEVKSRQEADHTVKMYDLLKQKLEKENGWQVLSLETVAANPSYKEYFKSKTEGFQNRPIMNDRYNLLQPAGILDSFAVYTTKSEVLQKVQTDLKVDALLVVSTRVDLNNSGVFKSLIGKGTFNPIATTALRLTDAKTETKLWMDSNVAGEPAANEDKNFLGLAAEEKLNQLALVAAESSYNKVLSQYKEKLSQ